MREKKNRDALSTYVHRGRGVPWPEETKSKAMERAKVVGVVRAARETHIPEVTLRRWLKGETGLTPSRVEGTTPHGHRHAYGGRLARAGVSGADIQRYMHRCSSESHLVYAKPLQSEVASALKRAAKRLSDRGGLHHWDSCVDEFEYLMRRS
jgi:integrase